jgi:protein-S-isoprenylcysteine O-methyltransferase Ste14
VTASHSPAALSRPVERRVRKRVIIGWIIEFAGTALWLYGYFAVGHPSLIDWPANTPWWIANYLPNIESEIGLVLVCAAMIPMYWPSRR